MNYDHQSSAIPTERSEGGRERWERRRWREERPERVAAVEKFEDQRKPEEFFGHRNSPHGNVGRCKSFSAADKMFFIMLPVADEGA